MADPRFFQAAGPFTVGRLAEISGAQPAPGSDADGTIEELASWRSWHSCAPGPPGGSARRSERMRRSRSGLAGAG